MSLKHRPGTPPPASGWRTRAWVSLLVILSVDGFGKSLTFPPYLHSYGIRKATPKHLFMFFGPTTQFDDPQGIATTRMVTRDDPAKDEDDDEVVVYGVNAGRHQLIYNTSMWSLALYGSKGSGRDQFFHPRGVAAEPYGNVFVADSGNGRIVHLYNPRKTVHWVRSFTGAENGGSALLGPTQVALDERCLIYVSDARSRRLVVFDTLKGYLRTIRPDDTAQFLDGPTTLAVADGRSRWSYFHDEFAIYCADRSGTRLWKLGPTGRTLATTPVPPGHHCDYAAADYYHNLWVTDTRRHCILKYDHELRLLDVFGGYGTGDDEFIEPRGIAIWKRFGQTFIAEKQGAQYYWIGTECAARTLTRLDEGRLRLSVDLTEYSFVTVWGRVIGADTCFLVRKRLMVPHHAELVVKSPPSCPIQSGQTYTLRVEPTYSSYSFRSWEYPLTVNP